jgi:hypothetical protein
VAVHHTRRFNRKSSTAYPRYESSSSHSELVTQDVLILTGEEDSFAPLKLHDKEIEALKNAKLVTGRIFTWAEQAHKHFPIGRIRLALDVIWLTGLARKHEVAVIKSKASFTKNWLSIRQGSDV